MSEKASTSCSFERDGPDYLEDDRYNPEGHLIPKDIRLRRGWRSPPSYRVISWCLLASVLLNVLLPIYFTLTTPSWGRAREFNDDQCTKLMNAYSPLFPGLKYEWFTFPNRLQQPSIYRGQPTEDLEDAWDKLAERHEALVFSFPPSYLGGINKSEARDGTYVPVQQVAIGQGDGLYAQPEFAHQLHCLNLIRKYTYRNSWDYTGDLEWKQGEQMLRGHVDHCIEILRVVISCYADVTPVLIYADPSLPLGGYPDFETIHRCRRLDDIKEWARSENMLFQLRNVTIDGKEVFTHDS